MSDLRSNGEHGSVAPWISIVVPSFNQGRFIEATLRSLFQQNEAGLEIIVIDGGSRDGAKDIIDRYGDRLAFAISEPDRGQSHALNKGFARARGRWLGWLGSDDLLLPGALAQLRAHINRAPDRRWWIGGGYFIDEEGKRLPRNYRPPHGLSRPEQLHDWREFWFAQPSTFFRRDLFDRAGRNIDESLAYAMDLDLWLRLLAVAPPGFIDAEMSAYRHYREGKTDSMAGLGEAEIVKVIARHLGIDLALGRVKQIADEWTALRRQRDRLLRVGWPAVWVVQTARAAGRRLVNRGRPLPAGRPSR